MPVLISQCSPASFESLALWAEEYKHYTVPEKVVKILVGNKNDLKKRKKIDSSSARKFADRFNMPFWEVSTKNDSDKEIIESIFSTLAEKLHKEKPATSLNKTRNEIVNPKGDQAENVNPTCELKGKLEKEKKSCCSSN